MTSRAWTLLGGLIASLLIGGWLLREPLFQPYRALQTQIEEDNRKYDELSAELERRKSSTRTAGDVLERLGDPLDGPARAAEATRFYRRVEALVLGSGLSVETIQPRPSQVSPDGLVKFPAAVTLTGDLRGLTALLAQFRATRSLLEIERLTIRRRDDERQPLTIQAIFVAYGQADQATLDQLRAEAARGRRS